VAIAIASLAAAFLAPVLVAMGQDQSAATDKDVIWARKTLTAFPHLFPPSSNQWTEGADLDPATDTIASPDIWTDFADFYKLATGTAKIADEMSRAANEDAVKSLHRALGINCDLCHSLYLKE
jgi:cytochrome c556